jgi:stringent starvation protein B
MDNEYISFNARFQGNSNAISIPVANVMAVFAKENGEGMEFSQVKEPEPSSTNSESQNNGLKLVK